MLNCQLNPYEILGGAARARSADPEFYPLLERLRRSQDSGAIGLRVQKTNEMDGVLMSFRGKVDASLEEDTLFVRKTLGLDPAAYEFRVVYGSIAKDDKELALLSRSVLEIIIGVKYIRFMMNQYYKNKPMSHFNKGLFTFAAYNAGPGRIAQLRKLAEKRGLNPNIRFKNVELLAAEKIGRETVQ